MYKNIFYIIGLLFLFLNYSQCLSYISCSSVASECEDYENNCRSNKQYTCVAIKRGLLYDTKQAVNCCDACQSMGAEFFKIGYCSQIDQDYFDREYNDPTMNGDDQDGEDEQKDEVTDYGKCIKQDPSQSSQESKQIQNEQKSNDDDDETGKKNPSQKPSIYSYCGIVMDLSNQKIADIITGTSQEQICSISNVSVYYYGSCDPDSAAKIVSKTLNLALNGDLKLGFLSLVAYLLIGVII